MLTFDHSKEVALFYGTEQEGPLKGYPTLFVVGNVPINKINEHLIENNRIEHIYFGAGGGFQFNHNTIETVSDYINIKGITIESPNIDIPFLYSLCSFSLHKTIYWMCPIVWKGEFIKSNFSQLLTFPELLKSKILIKIDAEDRTAVTPLSCFLNSAYIDYKDDKLLYQKEIS
jgi:hypothetical protein